MPLATLAASGLKPSVLSTMASGPEGRNHLIEHMFRKFSQALQPPPDRFHGPRSGQRFAAHAPGEVLATLGRLATNRKATAQRVAAIDVHRRKQPGHLIGPRVQGPAGHPVIIPICHGNGLDPYRASQPPHPVPALGRNRPEPRAAKARIGDQDGPCMGGHQGRQAHAGPSWPRRYWV